jgi:iron complex transport system substrate-binding protein
MRVVSLTCSNTEIVAALGCGGSLVGVDDHSDHPAPLLAGLPRVGKDLDVDAARVAALQPDLVLASLTVPGHERVVERLLAHKLNLLVLAPTALAHVARDVRQVGGALGVGAAAEALAAKLEAAFSPDAAAPAPGRAPRVLVEWWPRPCIAAGGRSWVDGMLRLAGAENALAEDVESRPLGPGDPPGRGADAVVVSWCGVPFSHYKLDKVLGRPGWEGVPAVRCGQVYAVPEAWLGRPGPRLVAGLAALRAIVAGIRSGAPLPPGPVLLDAPSD